MQTIPLLPRLATLHALSATVCVLALIVSSACDRASGGAATVDDVRISEIPGADRPLRLDIELIAELTPPDSALTAVPWGVSADPRNGRIYAIDWTSPRLVVFDRSGEYIGEYGREGGGPGEFRNPVATTMSGDTLVVWDAGRSTLSRWSPEGTLIGETPAPLQYWGPGFAIDGERVVTVTTEQGPSGARMIQRIVAAARDSQRTIFELPIELGMMEIGGSPMPAPKVFAPSPIWNAADGRLYVLKGPEYRIDSYADGRWASSIRRDIPSLRVSRSMAAEAVASGASQYSAFIRRAGITAEQIVSAVGHEEVTSPVQAITAAPKGDLWVTRTTDGIRPSSIDIITADGEYLGTFDAPGIPVAFPSPNQFVALRLDEETGSVRLMLYRADLRRAAR